MKTHQPRIALALPDSKPWGITRFFNGVNDYASIHKGTSGNSEMKSERIIGATIEAAADKI